MLQVALSWQEQDLNSRYLTEQCGGGRNGLQWCGIAVILILKYGIAVLQD